jgi:hypothetical protein
LEQLIIGRIGSKFKVNESYWSRFKKFLVEVGLLKGGRGGYLGFDDDVVSGLFESEFGGGGEVFGIGMNLGEFFRYGLRDNEGGFNWSVDVVNESAEINSSGRKKMVFGFNPYVNFVDGEVYWSKDSLKVLKDDFIVGRIGVDEFLEKRNRFGGDSQNFWQSLQSLRLDEYFRNSFDEVNSGGNLEKSKSSYSQVSLVKENYCQHKIDKSSYRNRFSRDVNYISYSRIAELLGLNSKIAAWYMMQSQDSVILRNDRIDFGRDVKGVVENFGLGIREILSVDDFEMNNKKKNKKDDSEGGELMRDGDDIPPIIDGPIGGMDFSISEKELLENSEKIIIQNSVDFSVNNSVNGSENSVNGSENSVNGSENSVVLRIQ